MLPNIQNMDSPSENPVPKKESWDFKKFRELYDSIADARKAHHFVTDTKAEPDLLGDRYNNNPYCKTILDFAETVFSMEQGDIANYISEKYQKMAGKILNDGEKH